MIHKLVITIGGTSLVLGTSSNPFELFPLVSPECRAQHKEALDRLVAEDGNRVHHSAEHWIVVSTWVERLRIAEPARGVNSKPLRVTVRKESDAQVSPGDVTESLSQLALLMRGNLSSLQGAYKLARASGKTYATYRRVTFCKARDYLKACDAVGVDPVVTESNEKILGEKIT